MNTVVPIRPHDIALFEKQAADLIAEYPELNDDEQLRQDMIEGSTSLSTLLDVLLTTIRQSEADKAGRLLRIQGLESRVARDERRIEQARKLALRLMENVGIKKMQLPEGTFSLANAPQTVQIVDEEQIPAEFWKEKVTRSVDRKALKEALQSGTFNSGGAYLSNGGSQLRVL
jgi:hypothetical protein